MKIIKQPAAQEIAEYTCDVCGKPAVSDLKFDFGYGSDFDLQYIKADFCNEHGSELRELLLKRCPALQMKGYFYKNTN